MASDLPKTEDVEMKEEVNDHEEMEADQAEAASPEVMEQDDEEFKPETEEETKHEPIRNEFEDMDSFKRFEQLLKKTENFSKKLSTGDALLSSNANKKKRGRPSAVSDRRHAKTEEEEDNELLAQEGALEDLILFDKSPAYIKNGELRDYQVRGLNWMIQLNYNRFNGILADEMGLGKTLQTISLLGYMKHYKNHNGHFLVIVPKSTLQNWQNEFNKWCPSIKTIVLIGDAETRAKPLEQIKNRDFEAVITSYEMVLKCLSDLKKIVWYYMVIDEAHRIKNEHSKLAESVRVLKTKNRLLLTGTPLQNNLHELWSLLNFLLPDIFNSAEDFDSWFHNDSVLGSEDIIKRLHRVLQPFLLRRIKADVEKSLLPKKEVKVFIGLSKLQKEWYTKVLMKDIDIVNTHGKVEKKRLMNILMHLRKCCNHPYLFDGAEPGPPFTTDQHLVEASGKMVLLDKLLSKLQQQGSRVLIFSQMSRMLDILEDYCMWRNHKYCRLDGSTAHELRHQQIDEYNKEGSDKFIFMLTTRAGGLGINLTSADVVIIYDSDWNPQMDLQAMDRAHRIGQKKQVRVFRLITENTCEERIIERAERKLRLDSVVIQQGRLAEAQKTLGADEMLSMVRHGANQIFQSKDSTITDEDIEVILSKAEDKTKELNDQLDKLGESNLREFKSIYDFDGENFKGKSIRQTPVFIEPPKRERKTNYNIEHCFKEQTKQETVGAKQKAPRPKNLPQIYDFQFHPKRLYELIDNEVYYFRKVSGYEPTAPEGLSGKDVEKYLKEEKKKMDKVVEPTNEMLEERENLYNKAVFDWSRKEFSVFQKSCEKYGRKDYAAIAKEIGTKTEDEVQKYSEVFWKRYKEIKDWDRIVSSIVKGEEKLRRKDDIKRALKRQIESCKDPLVELTINAQKNKSFVSEEDRFLLVKLNEFGYDSPDIHEQIRKAIRDAPQFKFNWFFRSRTAAEIGKRLSSLIPSITTEEDDEQEEKARKRMHGTPVVKGKKKKV
ncbi:unnamed protein product [Bursaphelenchus okinawaensis]|uniref:Uncharacterized protein n=1 Tax=Bursaphelenchus okinawaensis TaxID=465554 RepID=A0A811L8X6_9BILA|nr:unnamed protein product [Bursaphelenchus okinawaensis]CAG9119725.1 unnamed protein product [Bursaphelenchus okinawaensis]